MLERIKKILSPKRTFESFQIEITSQCFLRCVMCPRTAFLDNWETKHMSWETFSRISAYFPYAKLIYLQGWGEPLLHDRIFDMIRVVKNAGCEVGFTTNGALMSREYAKKIAELGVDIIGISIAGATKVAHESVRIASNFEKLCENIATLSEVKKELSSRRPKIVLSYLRTKTNIAELPDAVELAHELGADEVVATNLDYTATQQHDALKIFSCEEESEEHAAITREAAERAKEIGIPFRAYPLKTEEVLMCELNPLKFVFFSHRGEVSPCVYLTPSLGERIPRIFCGRSCEVQSANFGNVNEEGLFAIWNKKEYAEFRRKYQERIALGTGFDISIDFDSVEKLRESARLAEEKLKAAALPEACRSCYKAHGI